MDMIQNMKVQSKDEVTTYVITNTHVPEVVSKSVEKVWNDNNNQDGKRPENIKVQLKSKWK